MKITAAAELLSAELYGNCEVHRSRIAIELGRRIFPLLDGFDRRLMQQGRTGDDFGGGDVAVLVDERVNLHVAGDML